MSTVRVLVGTRKGAFILTSDGKRQQWDVSGPLFGGWEIYHLKGSPADPNRLYASQSSGWFGQMIQRQRRRRQDLAARGQQVRLRRRSRHAPVVRRHAASLGIQTRLASRAVAHRSRHRLRRRGRRRPVPLRRRRANLAGTRRPARPRLGAEMAARRRRNVPAHDPPRSEQPRPDLHRHLSGRRLPQRRRRPDLAADQPRAAVRIHPRPDRRGRPLRASHRHAPLAPRRAVHAEALGRHAQRRRRRFLARGQRQPADRFRLPHRRPRPRAGDDLRRPHQERRGALSARGQAAGLSQPQRRKRVGAAHQRPAAKATAMSTCCATRWPSTALDPCGVYFGTTGGQVYASADAGDNWTAIVRDLPAVLSVEVQTLP